MYNIITEGAKTTYKRLECGSIIHRHDRQTDRRMLRISWTDCVPNTEVLRRDTSGDTQSWFYLILFVDDDDLLQFLISETV